MVRLDSWTAGYATAADKIDGIRGISGGKRRCFNTISCASTIFST
jgi:hypothetical protein